MMKPVSKQEQRENSNQVETSIKPAGLSFHHVLSIKDYIDVDGRPLGEHRASEAIKSSAPMELKQCPYLGSRFRHQHPMNASALRQLSTHWRPCLALIQTFRHHWVQYHGRSIEFTVDYLRVAGGIASIPSWMVNRSQDPVSSRAIPAPVSAMYKIVIGLHQLMKVKLSGEIMANQRHTKVGYSAEVIAQYADMGGFLIGSEQVCAGSPKQIMLAIEAMMFGTIDLPPAEEELKHFLRYEDRFFEFAECIFRYNCADFALRCLSILALTEIRSALSESADFIQRIDVALEAIDPAGTLNQFVSTRTLPQLHMLINGWHDIAVNGCGLVHPDDEMSREKWAERLPPFSLSESVKLKIVDYMVLYSKLERVFTHALTQKQEQLNISLVRSTTEEPFCCRREFNPTFMSVILTEFKLEPTIGL